MLKPSEHASATTLELARLVEHAGLPPGVFNVITGLGPEVGGPEVCHPDVAKINFTGAGVLVNRVKHSAIVSIVGLRSKDKNVDPYRAGGRRDRRCEQR